MKTKHTPGPWTAVPRSINPNYPEIKVENVDGLRVANVGQLKEQQANARLIAAAPDMLEALKAIDAKALEILASMANAQQCPLACALLQPLLNARAAIAKATATE